MGRRSPDARRRRSPSGSRSRSRNRSEGRKGSKKKGSKAEKLRERSRSRSDRSPSERRARRKQSASKSSSRSVSAPARVSGGKEEKSAEQEAEDKQREAAAKQADAAARFADLVAPPRARIQSFEEILAAVRAGAVPTSMPVRAGSALPGGGGNYGPGAPPPGYGVNGGYGSGGYGHVQLPARPLYDTGFRGSFGPRGGEECAQASVQALAEARILAKGAEDAGRQAARAAGAPSGPPGLPTGVMVVEQKFVDFLVGPGGQSLASINYAAGVTVALDQAAKFSGYSVANIYGPEASTDRAKLAIDFKLSQWLPRGMSRGPPGTGTSWFPAPGQMATSSPTSSQTTAKQPAAPLPALTAALVTAADAGTAGML